MRKARAAGAPRLHLASTPAVLVATALLLGCAVPPLPSARAASAGGIPAPSSASLATLRRSGQHRSRHDDEQEGSQMPLTTAAPRGRGSGRTSPSWFAAQTTRGGGIFRRRRGGGGDGGGGSVSNSAEKQAVGEEAGRDDLQKTKSEGFAVAAGTTGGGGGGDGDGSSSADVREEGGSIEGEDGGGSESDGEVCGCVSVLSGHGILEASWVHRATSDLYAHDSKQQSYVQAVHAYFSWLLYWYRLCPTSIGAYAGGGGKQCSAQ